MALDVNPGETLEDFTKRAAEYYATCMAAAVAVVETAAEVLNMEQATAEAGERFEQMPFERTRIDREAGILYGVIMPTTASPSRSRRRGAPCSTRESMRKGLWPT